MSKPEQKIISVDLGGTWMRAVAMSPEGVCGPVVRKPTEHGRPCPAIIDDLIAVIRQAGADGFDAVTVGIPTVLDAEGGLSPCDNLPTMGGVKLADVLEARLKVPATLFNDAACFAAGEWWRGTGKGTRNFCGVTLGTGIGLGLVINGLLHTGSHGCAGEIWKTPYGSGILEDEVCGRAIVRNFEARSGRRLDGQAIAELARQKDFDAVEVFRGFGNSLGRVIALVVNLVDPEVVAFGGSVARSFDLFADPMREIVRTGTVAGSRTKLMVTELGEQAGLFGAARLYWENTHV